MTSSPNNEIVTPQQLTTSAASSATMRQGGGEGQVSSTKGPSRKRPMIDGAEDMPDQKRIKITDQVNLKFIGFSSFLHSILILHISDLESCFPFSEPHCAEWNWRDNGKARKWFSDPQCAEPYWRQKTSVFAAKRSSATPAAEGN